MDNVVYLHLISSSARVPRKMTPGSAAFDVASTEHVVLWPFQRKLISTGLRVAPPAGTHALLLPRSSIALRKGLTLINAPGLIDSDYRGEIKLAVANLSWRRQEIKAGERLAQMLFFGECPVSWALVDELPDTCRGDGGFGSTGC